MLTILEKVSFLQNASIFQHVPTESLASVAAIAQEVTYAALQALFRQNDAAEAMFILLEGEVELRRDGREAQKLAANDVLGALAVLASEPHRESAIATRPTRALQIDQQEFYDVMAEDFNVTREILRTLVRLALGPG